MNKKKLSFQCISFLLAVFFIQIVIAKKPLAKCLYQVFINSQNTHKIFLVLKDDQGNLWAESSDIKSWLLKLPKEKPYVTDGELFYPLRSISGLKYTIDVAKSELYLNAKENAFKPYIIDLYEEKKLIPQKPNALGGFINYDLFAQKITSSTFPNTPIIPVTNSLIEIGAFDNWGSISSNFLIENIGGNDRHSRSDHTVRLNTAWVYDDPQKMRTFSLGDSISSPSLWGRSACFGGLQWRTNYSTQPYFNKLPLPSAQGAALLPSTMEIYVNHGLMEKRDLQAGVFQLNDIPIFATGSGMVDIVVTDILGRRQIISVPFFNDATLLKQGLHDFSIESGFIRHDYGRESFSYKEFMLAGTDNYGITNSITQQVHAEISQKVQNFGAGWTIACSNYGLLTIAGAGSHSDYKNENFGGLGMMNFSHSGSFFSYGIGNIITTSRFRLLGETGTAILIPTTHRHALIAQHRIFTSFPLPFYIGNFGLSYAYQRNRATFNSLSSLTASLVLSLGRIGSMNISASRDLGPIRDKQIFMTLNIPLALTKDSITNITAINQNYGKHSKNSKQLMIQTQKPLSFGKGYGYRLGVSAGRDSGSIVGGLSMKNSLGTYSIEAARYNDSTNYQAFISGGVATMKGKVFATRHIFDSFAIVNTGYPNIPFYIGNDEVARTNKHGYAILPEAWEYMINRVMIHAEKLPPNLLVENSELEFIPYRKSGLFLDFPITAAKNAALTLKLPSGEYVPVGAAAQLNDKDESFIVGSDGRLYLTGLSSQNKISVIWDDEECIAKVPYQQSKDLNSIQNLGTFICSKKEDTTDKKGAITKWEEFEERI